MKYDELTIEDKLLIKNLYFNKINRDKTIREIYNQLPLDISERCFKKVLIVDFEINLKRKTKYTLNEDYFEKIDTEAKAYFLGLLAADGFIGDKSNVVSLSLNDKDILEKFKECIEFSGEIAKTKKGNFKGSKEGYAIRINSEKMKKDLNNLGLFSKKSLNFNNIPNINNSLKRHFLRGYFDGDGSITAYKRTYMKNNRTYIYNRMEMTIIATIPFIENVIKEFNINKYSIKKSKTEGLKYLSIFSKEELKNTYKLMYDSSTIFLNRKREIWEKNIMSL